MSKTNVEILLEKIAPKIKSKDTEFRSSISVSIRLAVMISGHFFLLRFLYSELFPFHKYSFEWKSPINDKTCLVTR